MNAIIGFSELLEENIQNEKDKEVYVKLIQKNGEMLLSLINDIVDISKIEANLLSIRKKTVQLNNFLAEIGSHYKEVISSNKEKKIEFVINNNIPADITIQTDQIRLRQILDNLIGNALKFTSSGSITIDVNRSGELVQFCVTDTGIGISQDQQNTIFERFMQVEHGSKINYGGTGLGLAISKNLIELLGGNIHVKSEPGNGSAFCFDILAT
jgi:signal transduction histidine kinase